MTERKTFLGDRLYADFDGWNVIVTQENGIAVSDRIVFEPDVWDALVNYGERQKLERQAREKEDHGGHHGIG